MKKKTFRDIEIISIFFKILQKFVIVKRITFTCTYQLSSNMLLNFREGYPTNETRKNRLKDN